jgi:hypothetical protein
MTTYQIYYEGKGYKITQMKCEILKVSYNQKVYKYF